MNAKNYRFVKSDELMHYGVLGMRWGVHRAKVNKQKSIKAKKVGKVGLAKVYDQKAKYISAKHRTRVGSEKAYDRIRNTNLGKLAGQSLLLGTYGTLNYHRMRAKGQKIGSSAAKSVLPSLGAGLATGAARLNPAVGGYGLIGLSTAEPRMTSYRVSKQNRKNKAMNVNLAKADYKKAKKDYKKQKKDDKNTSEVLQSLSMDRRRAYLESKKLLDKKRGVKSKKLKDKISDKIYEDESKYYTEKELRNDMNRAAKENRKIMGALESHSKTSKTKYGNKSWTNYKTDNIDGEKFYKPSRKMKRRNRKGYYNNYSMKI